MSTENAKHATIEANTNGQYPAMAGNGWATPGELYGLSKREEFARTAMICVLNRADCPLQADWVADVAVLIADELLKRLSRKDLGP